MKKFWDNMSMDTKASIVISVTTILWMMFVGAISYYFF